MLVVAVDPGTGQSSPSGVVVFDSVTKKIREVRECGSDYALVHHRIHDISDVIEGLMVELEMNGESEVLFAIESFVMRGKGGETLQRLIGSLLGRVPYSFKVKEVSNTQMKLLIGGHGRANKLEVAEGAKAWFKGNHMSEGLVHSMIQSSQWDLTDALGIGIAAVELESA